MKDSRWQNWRKESNKTLAEISWRRCEKMKNERIYMKDEIFIVCFKINSLSCFFLHDALLYLYYAEYNNYLTHYIVLYIYNRMEESVVFTNLVTAIRVASGWCAIAVTSCMSCVVLAEWHVFGVSSNISWTVICWIIFFFHKIYFTKREVYNNLNRSWNC